MSDFSWTDERVGMLKKLFHDGLGASQIAREIGAPTRNSVIGKIHRLGLSRIKLKKLPSPSIAKPAKPPHQISATVDRNKSPKTPKGVRSSNNTFNPRQSPEAIALGAAKGREAFSAAMENFQCTEATELSPEEIGARAVRLVEARDHDCRWPIGDPVSENFRFCGFDAVANGPYCRRHSAIAYQAAPRPLRREAFSR
jgi:GcrA cell cycle regulator